jgi:YesN/AraC family two-component response regulator
VTDASLVWVDLRQVSQGSVTERLEEKFAVTIVRQICQIQDRISEQQPDLLIFEYDFPDIQRLKALQQTKIDNPHLPILMLTEHHSEELAVWAFRSGVRDYIVKPLDKTDLIRISLQLLSVVKTKENCKCRENVMSQPLVPRDSRINCELMSGDVLARAFEYLNSHFHEKVSLETVSSLCGLTRFEFSRMFKQHLGITFMEYLIRCRIRKAVELLGNPNARIIDIAYVVGFTNPSYFAKSFRKYTDMTPSEYRGSVETCEKLKIRELSQ